MELTGLRSFHKSDSNPKIVWLASYPKSGNTWLRSFLSVLISNKDLDINNLQTNGIFSGKLVFEDALDIDADYIGPQEVETLKRISFRYLSEISRKVMYIKIHDAYTFSEFDSLPLVPTEPTKMAIYLVRNPLDVALSLANHLDITVDNAIDNFLINPTSTFGKKTNNGSQQFFQMLGTWSDHVESWLKYPTFPVHFIRYEDLKAMPFETFKGALNAIGLEVSDTQINQAIELTRFEKLKEQEQKRGFSEKMVSANSFFFKGVAGRWKSELTEKQIKKIKEVNQPMMQHFGYW